MVSSLIVTLEKTSISIIISKIRGAANKESSQVLWMEMIFSPPQKMEESYSSKARLESPTEGIYLIIIINNYLFVIFIFLNIFFINSISCYKKAY